MAHSEDLYLLADIGGTHTRLALQRGSGDPYHAEVFDNRDYPGLAEIVEDYLTKVPPGRPTAGAFAVACPVTGDRIHLTNLAWEFSTTGLQERLGFEALEVVNDFAAQALAVPELGPDDMVAIGSGTPQSGAPVGVLGPGTGLGMAGLVQCDSRWLPIPGEGGHVTLAAANEQQARLIADLRRKYGHVSAERVLSGAGLVDLHRWCAGDPDLSLSPPEVTEHALAGDDPHAAEALALFFDMLGTVAGDLALTLGARGGIYLTGGILPRLREPLLASRFREFFVDKGRFRSYLEAVPTRLIVHPFPAFKGLSGIARRGGLTSRRPLC